MTPKNTCSHNFISLFSLFVTIMHCSIHLHHLCVDGKFINKPSRI
jgi:hypothetical protein